MSDDGEGDVDARNMAGDTGHIRLLILYLARVILPRCYWCRCPS